MVRSLVTSQRHEVKGPNVAGDENKVKKRIGCTEMFLNFIDEPFAGLRANFVSVINFYCGRRLSLCLPYTERLHLAD